MWTAPLTFYMTEQRIYRPTARFSAGNGSISNRWRIWVSIHRHFCRWPPIRRFSRPKQMQRMSGSHLGSVLSVTPWRPQERNGKRKYRVMLIGRLNSYCLKEDCRTGRALFLKLYQYWQPMPHAAV